MRGVCVCNPVTLRHGSIQRSELTGAARRSGAMCPQPASEAAESGPGPKGFVLFQRSLWPKDRPERAWLPGLCAQLFHGSSSKLCPTGAAPMPPPLQADPREPQPRFLKGVPARIYRGSVSGLGLCSRCSSQSKEFPLQEAGFSQ